MTPRSMKEISAFPIFKELISTFNMKYEVKSGDAYIYNDCVILHIYGFVSENTIYIDTYDLDGKTWCPDLARIIGPRFSAEEVKRIYDSYLNSSSGQILGSKEIEAYLQYRLEMLCKQLTDIVTCNFLPFADAFEPLTDNHLKALYKMQSELKL